MVKLIGLNGRLRSATMLALLCAFGTPLAALDACQGFGPQAPRDISDRRGENQRVFDPAPASSEMNLCNIHTHIHAEHRGPGFAVPAGEGDHGGYRCNETDALVDAEREDPAQGQGGFHGVAPGDTLEVHWVYTTCDVIPGEGLGTCVPEACTAPIVRVEAQVFLLVNDPSALDFNHFTYGGNMDNGLHQPWSLPSETGTPVEYSGSTTGPKYSESVCSPFQVTWSVRPDCARLDVNSLYEWGQGGNVFNEDHAHGIRRLVTALELLSPIDKP